MDDSSQGDIILRPSQSESNFSAVLAVGRIVFFTIALFNVPSRLEFSRVIYFFLTLALIYCVYRFSVTLNTFRPGNTFMRITSNGFRYRSSGDSYELSWDAISKFVVEDDEVLGFDSRNMIRFGRVQRLYVITLNEQEKLFIDYTFDYEALDLAVLLSRKMAKSLELPSYQHLLTVVDLKRGKPV